MVLSGCSRFSSSIKKKQATISTKWQGFRGCFAGSVEVLKGLEVLYSNVQALAKKSKRATAAVVGFDTDSRFTIHAHAQIFPLLASPLTIIATSRKMNKLSYKPL
jgi:hypothetical protein